jgi:PAS domain S-box-containing protein
MSRRAARSQITISGIELEWQPRAGTCTCADSPVIMMGVESTLLRMLASVQGALGPQRVALALEAEGQRSAAADWAVIEQHGDFRAGFEAIARSAAVAGWGAWELADLDLERRTARFVARSTWEGRCQRSLGISFGSALLAGKLGGYCSRLFKTSCRAEQTAFIARGDARDEFVVSPASRSVDAELQALSSTDEATRTDLAAALGSLEEEVARRQRKEEELSQAYEQLRRVEEELRAQYDSLVTSQQALRESEERYRLLVDNTQFPVVVTSIKDGRLVFVNQRALEFFEVSRDEASRLRAHEFWVHVEDRDTFVSALARDGQVSDYECELRSRSGKIRWVLITASLIDYDGERSAFLVYNDISERKRAEEALRESEERYRNFVSNAGEGIFRIDVDPPVAVDQPYDLLVEQIGRRAVIGEINSAAAAMYALTPEQILGRPMADFTPSCGVQLADLLQTASCSIVDREEQEVSADGQAVYIVESYKGVVVGGRLLRVWGVQRDITERKRAELALREEQQLSESLINTLPGIFFMFNRDGYMVRWNENHARLLGYPPEELRRRHISELVSGEDRDLVAAKMHEVFSGGTANLEAHIVTAQGERVPFLFTGTRVTRGDEEYLVGTAIDLTDRKRAEQERLEIERRLLHSQKLESLGVLAGGIAHDFNNLLMAILGNLDLALIDLSPVSPARELVEQAMRASRRASDLTRQMLAYSGKGKFVLQGIDLSELVLENAHLLKASIGKTASLALSAAHGLPLIEADPGQVQQVIMNLITNASEAIDEHVGVVTIATGVQEFDAAYLARSRVEDKPPPDRYVYVDVSDTGCGMSADTLGRLFEPFFTTKFTGRGLGMAAVLGIMRGHHGAIIVDSEVGRGTTIRVLFPVLGPSPAEVAVAATARKVQPELSGMALVVDDEEIVRSLCVAYLGRLGLRTLVAADGVEALQQFSDHADEIVCVILDLKMPRMDGVSTFRALKRLRPEVQVILCSGYNEQEATREFAGEGLAAFLQKPYGLQDLKRKIEQLLSRGEDPPK